MRLISKLSQLIHSGPTSWAALRMPRWKEARLRLPARPSIRKSLWFTILSPLLAFSIPALPPGSFPRSALSRFHRELLGLRPSHWNRASSRRPAFRLLCGCWLRLPLFLAQRGRDAVAGVALDPAHIPIW